MAMHLCNCKRHSCFDELDEFIWEENIRILAMRKIKELELQGCRMVMHFSIAEGFRSWKEAFRMREEHVMPRHAENAQSIGIYTLFKSVEELEERRFQVKYMMMEALHLYIIWLSPSHNLTIDTAIFISAEYFEDNYMINEFLMEIFRLNWENSNPLNKDVHFLFENIIFLRSHRRSSGFNCDSASKEISMYMDYIEEKVWPHLEKIMKKKNNGRERDFETYQDVAYNLLRFTEVFLEACASAELICELLSKLKCLIRKEWHRNLPTTLLHQIVKAVHLFGVKLLVNCGADIDAPDRHNKLPIHYIDSLLEEYDRTKDVESHLVQIGFEVNIMNCDGRSIQTFLRGKHILKHDFEEDTLKWLAAK